MTDTSAAVDASRILVVDDNVTNIQLIDATLRSAGFDHIVSVTKPLELTQHFGQHAYDLVLLDINMPLMDGFAVLSLMQQMLDKAQFPPVIMLTAQADETSRIKALENGASDYITKPFNRTELLKRVRIHLENWHLRQRLQQENQTLEAKVRERTEALETAQLEMIYRLGRAAEYRDNETGNHVRRVSLFAQAIAEQLGMDQAYCDLIRIASPMHDVGKIGVSDTILLKPGKLNDDEYARMQSHVEIGGEILSNGQSELLKMAREIALTHHEKYDGKGYPHGLKGEDIPLSGRIVAIADVYDALTSARPYKEAWPSDKAVALIEREKGAHFDPQLVDAFLAVLPRIRSISAELQD
ncbi:HD domain-containing phosphohydrolase [Thiomicrospira sp. WB1]|uniref:HD domain-containing phosphohydrolase n=1 Tax=Thiomicrospira sp. WB1 TaxID=1685380 RepID=UPI0007476011|nr:HD domain-containing phosphohydrolase [Thiomicrospira sp. WB1]KUJ72781.1 two-component system response regulator [Thiomicrospira sp. WB1]